MFNFEIQKKHSFLTIMAFSALLVCSPTFGNQAIAQGLTSSQKAAACPDNQALSMELIEKIRLLEIERENVRSGPQLLGDDILKTPLTQREGRRLRALEMKVGTLEAQNQSLKDELNLALEQSINDLSLSNADGENVLSEDPDERLLQKYEAQVTLLQQQNEALRNKLASDNPDCAANLADNPFLNANINDVELPEVQDEDIQLEDAFILDDPAEVSALSEASTNDKTPEPEPAPELSAPQPYIDTVDEAETVSAQSYEEQEKVTLGNNVPQAGDISAPEPEPVATKPIQSPQEDLKDSLERELAALDKIAKPAPQVEQPVSSAPRFVKKSEAKPEVSAPKATKPQPISEPELEIVSRPTTVTTNNAGPRFVKRSGASHSKNLVKSQFVSQLELSQALANTALPRGVEVTKASSSANDYEWQGDNMLGRFEQRSLDNNSQFYQLVERYIQTEKQYCQGEFVSKPLITDVSGYLSSSYDLACLNAPIPHIDTALFTLKDGILSVLTVKTAVENVDLGYQIRDSVENVITN